MRSQGEKARSPWRERRFGESRKEGKEREEKESEVS
jgi:hypothetical protein